MRWANTSQTEMVKCPKVSTFYFFFEDFFLLLEDAGVTAASASSRNACPVDLMCSNSLLRDVNVCWHLWHDSEFAVSAESVDCIPPAAGLL